jgi:ankyrin repeat protein
MMRRCAVVVAVALALGVADRHVVASPQELIDAVRNGDKELVARLLADGADVKVTRNQGLSALHFAVFEGNKEIAELLLAHGVDVNVADNNANTPLHAAASQGMAQMVALLLAKGANVNAKTNMRGFEGETDDYVGDTPLHLTALGERQWRSISKETQKKYASKGAGALTETAAVLLANGADVNATNDKGKTPLRLATSKEMKNLLRQHGAK